MSGKPQRDPVLFVVPVLAVIAGACVVLSLYAARAYRESRRANDKILAEPLQRPEIRPPASAPLEPQAYSWEAPPEAEPAEGPDFNDAGMDT